MKELSLNARTIAGSMFSFSPGASLRYAMRESIPSPEMQTALDELVAAGLVLRDDEPGGAVRYTASREADFKEFRKEAALSVLDGTSPSIRVFVKRSSIAESGGTSSQ